MLSLRDNITFINERKRCLHAMLRQPFNRSVAKQNFLKIVKEYFYERKEYEEF